MKRCFLCLLSALCLAVLLAGCASRGQTADADADLPVIKSAMRTIRRSPIWTRTASPPGIDVALAREAFSRMGYRPEFVPIDWVEKTHLLDSGAVDCLWSSFYHDDREDDYHWAGPYMLSRQVVAVMPGSEVQTLADLAGKTVAVQATTKPESLFLNHTDSRIPEVRALLTVQNRELIFTI